MVITVNIKMPLLRGQFPNCHASPSTLSGGFCIVREGIWMN